jgi:(p)ppGpp synthase/HD superfamily hydrolase
MKWLSKAQVKCLEHAYARGVIPLAVVAHAKQVDKQGKPLFSHAFRVAMALAAYAPTDEAAVTVAFLHDAIEDGGAKFTPYGEDWAIMPHNVTDAGHLFLLELSKAEHLALATITRSMGQVRYEDYILDVAKDPLATLVKYYDLADNMKRLPALRKADPEAWGRLLPRYTHARDILWGVLGFYFKQGFYRQYGLP